MGHLPFCLWFGILGDAEEVSDMNDMNVYYCIECGRSEFETLLTIYCGNMMCNSCASRADDDYNEEDDSE
jgi:hypothetical protein